MESFILFYEKCRLCLDQPGVCNMFEKEEFPHDIYLCTGVKVHPSDNLPQKICEKCSKVITSAKDLRVLATKNNAHLRSLFNGDDEDDDDEPRLLIDEGDISSSGNQTKSQYFKDKDKDPSPRRKEDSKKDKSSADPKPSSSNNKRKLTVRKDLFENSTSVTSSTKSNSESKSRLVKKIKIEDDTFYECAECLKQFDTSKKLYLHLRMHNKSVACPLDACGKLFATKGDLEKHFRTHTGEKPYTCNICGTGFAQRGTLKSHRESKHGNR